LYFAKLHPISDPVMKETMHLDQELRLRTRGAVPLHRRSALCIHPPLSLSLSLSHHRQEVPSALVFTTPASARRGAALQGAFSQHSLRQFRPTESRCLRGNTLLTSLLVTYRQGPHRKRHSSLLYLLVAVETCFFAKPLLSNGRRIRGISFFCGQCLATGLDVTTCS
jgi:hypothetical protein